MFDHLAEYLRWANGRALTSLMELPSFPDSAGAKFAHLLAAEEIWLCRLLGVPAVVDVWPRGWSAGDFSSWIERNASGFQAYLTGITPEGVTGTVTYSNSKGESFESRISDVLVHVVAHGSYHRGQIATDVKAHGGRPAVTDYVFFTRITR